MTNDRIASFEKIIYDLLCERFSKQAISAVKVRADQDSDGDPVLRVLVVLELNGKAPIDGHKLVSLARHMRSRLEHEQFENFPMISFVSKKEAGKLLEAV